MVGAGTDANVYISLFGDKSKIERNVLKSPKSGKNPFERNQKDEFIFENDDIGKVCFFNCAPYFVLTYLCDFN